jgi:hypothetical protein
LNVLAGAEAGSPACAYIADTIHMQKSHTVANSPSFRKIIANYSDDMPFQMNVQKNGL